MSQSTHRFYLLHALTPLHVGADEGVGGIDLPTMRERHTGFPLIPGSSVKGVLREEAELRRGKESEDVLAAFGPPQSLAGDFRSGLVFTDAQLLALPVRSLYGTFAWVTSAQVIHRLNRDIALAALGEPLPAPVIEQRDRALVPDGEPPSALAVTAAKDTVVFLEDLRLHADPVPEARTLAKRIGEWTWPDDEASRSYFARRLLAVHDDVFNFFARLGLEIRSRVKIDEHTGTAAKSGPWTEEHLPAESLLVGLALGRPTLFKRRASKQNGKERPETKSKWTAESSLQVLAGLAGHGPELRFGGHSTIGLGRARFRLVGSSGAGEGAAS
jgi:CRISPR-associated protein Cmr4